MYDVGPLQLTVGLAYLETLWLRMSHKNKAICRDPLTAHFFDFCMGRVRKEEVEDDDDQGLRTAYPSLCGKDGKVPEWLPICCLYYLLSAPRHETAFRVIRKTKYFVSLVGAIQGCTI